MTPPTSQAAMIRGADGRSAAMTPVVRKMPDPITLPSTKRTADPRPRARTRPSSSREVAGFMTGTDNGGNFSTQPAVFRVNKPAAGPDACGGLMNGPSYIPLVLPDYKFRRRKHSCLQGTGTLL